MVAIKSWLKRIIQNAGAGVAPMVWHLSATPRLLVMMYHRVLPASHRDRKFEQPGMYVAPETFAMHLHVLKEHFSFVQLDDWLLATSRGAPVPQRACAITFDDGWRDNYEYAFPLLESAQAPATIFLVADAVGTQYAFWPNQLIRLLKDTAVEMDQAPLPLWLKHLIVSIRERNGVAMNGPLEDMSIIDQIVVACKNTRSDAEMLEALRESRSSNEERDLFDWDEARHMLRSGLVRFGSHTRRHTRLIPNLNDELVDDEITGSKLIIEEHLGSAPSLFCYPNGDCSPAAVTKVRSLYAGAVTTARGWNSVKTDRHLLRRVGVHDDVANTPVSFLSRLAGIG